jgi:peroxiredoxin
MTRRIVVGQRLPAVSLARASGPSLEQAPLEPYLQGRRVVLVGLPGAFTPICTGQHIPELVAHAPSLKASGIDEIICVAPNSPWAVQAWAERTDPDGVLTFLSDGNLELTRACGLVARAPHLFLGECSARYIMILHHAVIERLAVETDIEQLTCTRPGLLVGA